MNATFDAFLRSWPFAPWLAVTLAVAALLYARGWRELHHRDPNRWHVGRLVAFLAGLVAIYLALASPIEPFASLLLSVHMLQHLLLMMVAPPLIWLGWPLFPILRGSPKPVRTVWVVPLLRYRPLRRTFAYIVHPLVAWPLYVASTWLWHLPSGYELGLTNDLWHITQHACFMASALLFWYPVVRPYPSRPRWSKWLLFPYLLLADVQNTLLAAWLTFSPRVLYSYYEQVPRLDGFSALGDQHLAGVLMWIPGSIAFLVPLFWIGVSYLFGVDREANRRRAARPLLQSQRQSTPLPFDLLATPVFGRFLRWPHARRTLQLVMLVIAGMIAFDGFSGPQVTPLNLAGVIPWIHWRGLLILSLLVAGNFFCMVCPFTLPRQLSLRWFTSARPWPQWLRSKWLATALVAIFLWSYEAFSLWDSPWTTAWIIVGYFVAAFVVDSIFKGASFCKYVCPIGQFNFVQSLMSPFEVAVREPAVCNSCETKECIRGSDSTLGCQTYLFQPQKRGNFDCTFCLDCVHACPQTNVGVFAIVPGRTLWIDPFRSGIGRFSCQLDIAALVLVLVFGAFANAASMVEPIVEWQDRIRLALGDSSKLVITTASYFMALIVLPLATVALAVNISHCWARLADSKIATASRFTFALAPIGLGMWLAHYSFHLFTSWDTIIPATQRFAATLVRTEPGNPLLQCACCQGAAAWILRVQILMLDFGLLASLYAGFRTAEATTTCSTKALKAFAPWAALIVLLFVLGVWIVFQPMEMRGT